MDLHAERLPRISTSQYRQQYSSPMRQDNYGHRIDINDDRVNQSSVGYSDRNRPLLSSTMVPINEQRSVGRSYSPHSSIKASDYLPPEQTYYYTPSSEYPIASQQPKKSSSPPRSLGGIYKNSRSAVEFASNFEQYLTSCMSSYLWILLMGAFAIWGLILLLVGTFNIPFCPSQPMIPIFLIVAGCLYLLWSVLRMYAFWPSSRTSNTLGVDVTCKVSEGLVFVAILVWLFMGCFWVYGPKQYIHFQREFFERHYCAAGVYWIAFVNVTLQLTLIAVGLLFLACMLCTGLVKEDR